MPSAQQFYDINEGTWTTGGVSVRFYPKSVQDQPASDAAGRPVYKDVVYLEKRVPGDRLVTIDRPMRESDKMEFPEQWRRYEVNATEKPEGQPLAEWPQVSRSQVEELAYFRVRTVEELARVPDSASAPMGPLFPLRDKARAYLDRAAAGAQEAKLVAEKEAVEARNRELETRLARLEQQQAEHASKKGK
jgi:hypothetical protein